MCAQIVHDMGAAGTERLKLKNAQLIGASAAHLVAILHGRVPDFETFDILMKDEPAKALQFLDAARVLNRVNALALAGAIPADTIKETKLGQAVTMYLNPVAAPAAPTRALAEKVQKTLKDIWSKRGAPSPSAPAPNASAPSASSPSSASGNQNNKKKKKEKTKIRH